MTSSTGITIVDHKFWDDLTQEAAHTHRNTNPEDMRTVAISKDQYRRLHTVAISKDQYRRLRIYAATHDKTMRRALEDLIDEYLNLQAMAIESAIRAHKEETQ